MATMGETETETETVVPKPMEESQTTPEKAPDMSLKRKADDEAPEEDSSKRVKHSDESDEKAPGDDAAPLQRAPSPDHDHRGEAASPQRQPSPSHDHRDDAASSQRQPSPSHERRDSQEPGNDVAPLPQRQPSPSHDDATSSQRRPSLTQKHGDGDDAASAQRQESPTHDRRDDNGKEGASSTVAVEDRRKQVMQEEKRRGKRLFGGLMSTLSQTSNTSQQQKRRQEIERRQQDRMQKQMAEDDQRRSERLEKLRASRMADQIVFEEQVMKKKHENRLAMAKFLRTRAEPAIFYLPWRTTSTQKDIIEDQIEKARIANDREAEQFKARKQRHIERYGPPTRQRSVTPDEPAAARAPEGESPPRSPRHGSADKPQVQERRASSDGQHKGHHDELGDDLEEAEEDMVIY
ncbi:pinin/SDK/memA/ protein conserved region domain-containing protein [Trichoderma aethiopicum]